MISIQFRTFAYRVGVLFVTSLAVLTTAMSCSLFPNLGGNDDSITLGILKKDPKVRDSFGRINNVRTLSGNENSNGLLNFNVLEINQLTTDNLFAITEGNGLYETENGGRLWERKYLLPVGSTLEDEEERNDELVAQVNRNNQIINTDLEISDRNPNLIFVSGVFNRIGKIWRSEDGGKNFREVFSEINAGNSVVGVQIDGRNDNIVYALLEGGVVIRSNDAGKTWTKIQDFQSNAVQIGVVPEFNNLLFILLSNRGLRISRDNGNTWSEVELTREASQIGENQTRDFTIRADIFDTARFGRFAELIPVVQDNNSFILLADQQIWYTDDLAQPFIKMVLPITNERYNIAAVAPDPQRGIERVLVSIDNNLFETENRGQSWTTNDAIGLTTEIGNINSIVMDQKNPNIIYMGLRN